ncbi:hypothetical protein [Listeria monocytogenes]|uniref:hypothetical protein n=1 Tax=Listeria monocytogenes TaxID=1639 RepID=UPI001CB71B5B|nr:hypothetical protein [Listeria monocytogenes]
MEEHYTSASFKEFYQRTWALYHEIYAFGGAEESKKENDVKQVIPKKETKTTEKKETVPFLSMGEEEIQNKERYTFALTPRARERLTIIRKKYKKRSDSAFLEELIDQLWDGLPED